MNDMNKEFCQKRASFVKNIEVSPSLDASADFKK